MSENTPAGTVERAAQDIRQDLDAIRKWIDGFDRLRDYANWTGAGEAERLRAEVREIAGRLYPEEG